MPALEILPKLIRPVSPLTCADEVINGQLCSGKRLPLLKSIQQGNIVVEPDGIKNTISHDEMRFNLIRKLHDLVVGIRRCGVGALELKEATPIEAVEVLGVLLGVFGKETAEYSVGIVC